MRGHRIAAFRAVQMARESDTFLPEMSMELPRRRDWAATASYISRSVVEQRYEYPVSRDAPIEEGQEAEIAAVQRPIITLTKNLIEKTSTRDKSA